MTTVATRGPAQRRGPAGLRLIGFSLIGIVIYFAVLATFGSGGSATAIQQVANALTLGSIYALIALGYTMVYGILELINFAHGDVFMVGAFVALTFMTGGLGLDDAFGVVPGLDSRRAPRAGDGCAPVARFPKGPCRPIDHRHRGLRRGRRRRRAGSRPEDDDHGATRAHRHPLRDLLGRNGLDGRPQRQHRAVRLPSASERAAARPAHHGGRRLVHPPERRPDLAGHR